jgi:hypothetical protein
MSPRDRETSPSRPSRSQRVASSQSQKKVSTWNYKCTSRFSGEEAKVAVVFDSRLWLVDLLIVCLRTDELFGIAEFNPGMEEAAEDPIALSSGAAAPASTAVVPPVVAPVSDVVAAEGFTILQKGFFFGVILGCVAVYMRMNKQKEKRFEEKSMA